MVEFGRLELRWKIHWDCGGLNVLDFLSFGICSGFVYLFLSNSSFTLELALLISLLNLFT
jgi:hypothetical protein